VFTHNPCLYLFVLRTVYDLNCTQFIDRSILYSDHLSTVGFVNYSLFSYKYMYYICVVLRSFYFRISIQSIALSVSFRTFWYHTLLYLCCTMIIFYLYVVLRKYFLYITFRISLQSVSLLIFYSDNFSFNICTFLPILW
jgi:hypothetical protein